MPDADIISDIYLKVKSLYEKQGGPLKEQLTKMTLTCGHKIGKHFHFDPHATAKEINGFFITPKRLEMKPGEFKEFKKEDPVLAFPLLQIVTPRFKPFNIDGKTIHQVGAPWHFGWITTKDRNYKAGNKNAEAFTVGDAANLLAQNAGDSNTTIPKSKAFMVNVAKK